MKRSIAALILFFFLAVTVHYYVQQPTTTVTTPDRSSDIRIGNNGPITMRAPAGPALPTDIGSFTPAQARAYAALGAVMDGRIEQLPIFDTETSAVVEQMRQLLNTQKKNIGDTDIFPPAIKEKSSSKTENNSDSQQVTQHAQAQNKLNFVEKPGQITITNEGHIISGQAVWAAIKPIPGQGLPLRITDRGEGGHVIAVFSDDFSTVRVNGGLVVPGRYYLIQGFIEINADIPIGVHIRPLNAVPSFHEETLTIPNANS